MASASSARPLSTSSSTYSDLAQLTLLPYLSASPIPTLILRTEPLLAALVTRESFRSRSRSPEPTLPRRGSGDNTGTTRAERTASVTSVGTGGSWGASIARGTLPATAHGESQAIRDGLGPLIGSLQPEWCNEAWVELGNSRIAKQAQGGVNLSRGTGNRGKAGRIAEDASMEDVVMGESAHETASRGGSATSTTSTLGSSSNKLRFLDATQQTILLSLLLDLLEAPLDPPRFSPGGSVPPPPPTSVTLGSISISATLLPSRTHFILSSTNIGSTHVTPPLSMAVSRTASPFLHPTRAVSPSTKSSTFSNSTRPTTNPLFFPSQLPPSPPCLDPYLEYLLATGTELGRLIVDHPWHTTTMGPIATWGPELRTMLSSLLASPYAETILFGDDSVLLYNDAYIATAGGLHPLLLGQTMAIGWGHLWSELGPVVKRVLAGETHSVTDHFLPMVRNGYPEETYHTFAYSPFRDGNGKVIGFVSRSFETTARVVAERRLATIRDLVQATPTCRTVSDFCNTTIACLTSNAFDIPFAVLYTSHVISSRPGTREIKTKADETLQTQIKLVNRGAIGIPYNHAFSPTESYIDLKPIASRQSTTSGDSSNTSIAKEWSWPFEEACLQREPLFIENLGGMTAGLEPRGWDDLPRHAVIVPIFAEVGQVVPQAVLVVGVNTRGAYDALYTTFLQLLARHTAIGLLAVTNAEADANRAAELIALDRAKSNFFSNVSHELRTPLTLVLGPLEDVLSQTEHLSPANRGRLLTVQKHANRLLAMVNKLLDFSSLEGGRMRVKYHPVKLGVISKDIATLFRDAIERTKITYKVSCSDDPVDSMPIYLAPDLWEKVMFNLIGNAVKYCTSGTIEVAVRSTRAEAVMSVRDTGVGIPSNELSRIFERFHRVDSTSRTTAGTGIGLALTLEIVKLLGGTMEVESEMGVGSTFSVRLPRGFTHLPIEQVVHQEPSEGSLAPAPPQRHLSIIEEASSWRYDTGATESPSASNSSGSNHGSARASSTEEYGLSAEFLNLKNSTVLLADDSTDIRTYVSSILSKAFTVVQVVDGQAALEFALKTPPSLIVTDIMMPRLDGRGLLAALRANPSTALIPVIFLSAQAGAEARAEALEQGADDYLVKPFQARELMARVNVHLQLGKMRAELERRVGERTRALIESETRYRGLADRYSTLSVLSPVGIFLVDQAGNLTYANPRWYEISGHPFDKPLSEWRDSVLPEDLEKTHAFFVDGINAGHDSESIEFRFSQGNWVQFELRAFHDVTSGDGFVGAITDISRPKKIEALHIQTVEQRAADSEENRRNQEQFIDMASHELRNPLSGVWQNAEVVGASLSRITEVLREIQIGHIPNSETLDDVYREMKENSEAVESIMLCASHQGRIADDILNVSKLNMGLLSINLVPFDLAKKVGEVLRMFDVECSQKRIALSVACGESIPWLRAQNIVADPSRLAQILINFLTNSVKYTADTPIREITIQLDAFEGPPPRRPGATRVAEPAFEPLPFDHIWVVVGVKDTGKGLSSEELQKLFLRFSQANSKTDQYSGFGLGLFVSRALVELHGGFIEVESTPGEGSCFRFAIPAARAQPLLSPSITSIVSSTRIKRQLSQSEHREAPPKSAKIGPESKPVHVLIVEDNLINQKIMRRQCKIEGYTVTVANHGREALDILLAEKDQLSSTYLPINIVLMDIEMPVMDGLSAIRELRVLEGAKAVLHRYDVIAVTGNARQGQIDECLASGFDDVAIKPYVFHQLISQIERLIEQQ